MLTRYRSEPEYVTGTFTETEGKDISACDVEVGLSSSSRTPPTVWQAPDALERPTLSSAKVSLLIDSGVQPGTYTLWVRVTDSPEFVVAPGKNELIQVV